MSEEPQDSSQDSSEASNASAEVPVAPPFAEPHAAPLPPKSWTGRIIVYLLYASIFGYLVFRLLFSVVADLYGSAPPERSDISSAEYTWCARRLIGLRNELEGQVTLELQYPRREGDPYARWTVWNEGWMSKFNEARTTCDRGVPALTQGYQSLQAMYDDYREGLLQIIETRTAAAKQLDADIKKLREKLGRQLD